MKNFHTAGLLIVLTILLSLLLTFGYIAFDHTFPEAGPVPVPATDEITSIRFCKEWAGSDEVEEEHYSWILESIAKSKPTRKMSVNDTPAAKPFYSLTIDTPDRTYRYYLYTESSQFYLECPYEGIYETDQRLLEFISGN